MRRKPWQVGSLAAGLGVLFACSAAFPVSAARAQSWEIIENMCNAQETENPGNPVSCGVEGVVLGVASNSEDRRSYSTQQFRNMTDLCIAQDPAHPWFDEVVGYCKVEVAMADPNTGAFTSVWVRFGDALEHGEFGGVSGLLVFMQKVSCDCYGKRPS